MCTCFGEITLSFRFVLTCSEIFCGGVFIVDGMMVIVCIQFFHLALHLGEVETKRLCVFNDQLEVLTASVLLNKMKYIR